MRTVVTEISAEMTASEAVVLTAVTNLNDGKINETIASFAEEFTFKDHGIGLDFNDKVRLAEFFQKMRELYPDSFVRVDTTVSSGDWVFVEWTLRESSPCTRQPYSQSVRRWSVSDPPTKKCARRNDENNSD